MHTANCRLPSHLIRRSNGPFRLSSGRIPAVRRDAGILNVVAWRTSELARQRPQLSVCPAVKFLVDGTLWFSSAAVGQLGCRSGHFACGYEELDIRGGLSSLVKEAGYAGFLRIRPFLF